MVIWPCLSLLILEGSLSFGLRCESSYIFSSLSGSIAHGLSTFRSTALGSALLAGAAIKLFGWDISAPETLKEVNTKGTTEFKPTMEEPIRKKKWEGWQRAVERSKGWDEGVDE